MPPMKQDRMEHSEACGLPCDRCPGNLEGKPLAGPETLAGGRMVLASAAVFLLPLATAVAGAIGFRGGPFRQLTGALVGFTAGGTVAAVLVRLIRRHKKALS